MNKTTFGIALLLAGAAWAQTSPYAGDEGREIASLSAEDVAALRAGQGWELAKPAELNGWPGPRHALDLREALELTPEQATVLEAVFAAMQAEAQRVGAAYIAAERALDAAFHSGGPDRSRVEALTAEAGRGWAELRAVHLGAHLETRAVLSDGQVAEYDRRRGYGAGHEGGHGGH